MTRNRLSDRSEPSVIVSIIYRLLNKRLGKLIKIHTLGPMFLVFKIHELYCMIPEFFKIVFM